jgi:hypothetical protein
MFWRCEDDGGGGSSESGTEVDAGSDEADDDTDTGGEDSEGGHDSGYFDDPYGIMPDHDSGQSNPWGLSLGADEAIRELDRMQDEVDRYSPRDYFDRDPSGGRAPAGDGAILMPPSVNGTVNAPPAEKPAPVPEFSQKIPTEVPGLSVKVMAGPNGPGVGASLGDSISLLKSDKGPNVSLKGEISINVYPFNIDKSNVSVDVGVQVDPINNGGMRENYPGTTFKGFSEKIELGEARDGTYNYFEMLFRESLRAIDYP